MPSALLSTGIQFPNNTVQRRAFPSGGILMWYGNIASIPSGWFLCNGSNGTPDLRDRFVVGAGSSYSVGATGGANSVAISVSQMASHTHPVTASSGSSGSHSHPSSTSSGGTHGHGFPILLMRSGPAASFGAGGGNVGNSASISPANPHSHSVPNSGSGGSHSHPISISYGNTGNNDAHENRPPFYGLVFIMKG
jgi:microcystin-dependent protein